MASGGEDRVADARVASPAAVRWAESATACCTGWKFPVLVTGQTRQDVTAHATRRGTARASSIGIDRAAAHMVPGTSFCQAARIASCTLAGSGM